MNKGEISIKIRKDGMVEVTDGRITLILPESYQDKRLIDFLFELNKAYEDEKNFKLL